MKLWTKDGEVTLNQNDLDRFDKEGKKELSKAKKKGIIHVEDHFVYFKLQTKFSIPSALQNLLRNLINIEAHGKTYSKDEVESNEDNKSYFDAHHGVSCGHALTILVKFDLRTGELSIANEANTSLKEWSKGR